MPDWLVNIPAGFWAVLSDMSPYLLFGFAVAGALSVLVSPEFIERHLGGRGIWPVAKASAFGVPLPLCSCGVIPVAASLRKHGASKGATVGFLISTPQTGVDSVLVTLSLLGPVFAVFRPLVALASGLIGGTLASVVDSDDTSAGAGAAACQDSCCSADPAQGRFRRALAYGFVALPRDIGRALLVGLVLAAVISAALPPKCFAGVLGGGIGAMVIMMLAGMPIYVCATASIPVVAALIAKGLSPGAALVFLMTGPATNAAAIVTIWRVLGRRTAVVYLLTVAFSALGAGVLLDFIFDAGQVPPPGPAMGWMLPEPVKWACAVVLLGVLAGAIFPRRPGAEGADEQAQHDDVTTLAIKGMTCSHCAGSVRRAVLACPGVTAADVDLATGRATVSGGEAEALGKAVEALGFSVTGARAPDRTEQA